jgi:hypothetical protein
VPEGPEEQPEEALGVSDPVPPPVPPPDAVTVTLAVAVLDPVAFVAVSVKVVSAATWTVAVCPVTVPTP